MEKMKKNKYFSNKSQTIFLSVILFLPISNLLIFWLYVSFGSILQAFQQRQSGGMIWTMNNFGLLFREISTPNSVFWLALRNTLLFFGSNLLITMPISVVMCYFLYKKIFGFRVFRVIFYLPSIVSASVLVVVFKYIIATNGPLGTIVTMLGGEPVSLLRESSTAIWTILFYSIFMSFGGNLVLLSGAMSHIDKSIIEAAQIDGAGLLREFFGIVIPLIWPTLSTLIIFAFVGIFGASGPILLFTQGGADTMTISYWIYEQVYKTNEYYYPAAIGIIFTMIGMPISLSILRLFKKSVESAEA